MGAAGETPGSAETFPVHIPAEGWDIKTGWPARKTLEEPGLKKLVNALGNKRKLEA
jgi:hypothetical protein